MSTELIANVPELEGVEKSRAKQIQETFQPMANMLKEFESHYDEVIKMANEEITEEVTAKAKRLRLDIAKVRIQAEKVKKSEKEEILRAGRAVDGVFNILKWAVSEKEDKLKEIEKHFETIEAEKVQKLQAKRATELAKYLDFDHEPNLTNMEDDVWEAYINTKKKEHADRVEAEKKAEADRIEKEKAEKAEQERVKAENAKLKAEAEAKAKQDKVEADKRAKEESDRKAEHEAQLAKERKETERLESELRAKEEAERKVKEKAKEEAEAKAKLDADVERNQKMKDEANDYLFDNLTSDSASSMEIIEAIERGDIPHISCSWKL